MGKKAATANKRKTKQTPIIIILYKPHGLFCVLFIACVDYASDFKVSKLSLKVNNLTFNICYKSTYRQ